MESLDITDQSSFIKMKVMETLRLVIDPELEINIVDMGLVYAVSIGNDELIIDMTLSSPNCPMGGTIVGAVQNCLEHHYPQYKTQVNLVWQPLWSFENITREGKRLLGL